MNSMNSLDNAAAGVYFDSKRFCDRGEKGGAMFTGYFAFAFLTVATLPAQNPYWRITGRVTGSGGKVNYLLQLVPGIISTNAPTHGWLPQAGGSISSFAVAGTRTESSEFALDGIRNNQ
jgi:hypothetical protein